MAQFTKSFFGTESVDTVALRLARLASAVASPIVVVPPTTTLTTDQNSLISLLRAGAGSTTPLARRLTRFARAEQPDRPVPHRIP